MFHVAYEAECLLQVSRDADGDDRRYWASVHGRVEGGFRLIGWFTLTEEISVEYKPTISVHGDAECVEFCDSRGRVIGAIVARFVAVTVNGVPAAPGGIPLTASRH